MLKMALTAESMLQLPRIVLLVDGGGGDIGAWQVIIDDITNVMLKLICTTCAV